MDEIAENRICRQCGKIIPKTRKMGSIYCTLKERWTFHNRDKAKEREKLKVQEPALYNNYKLVKNLVRMGTSDISVDTAIDLGMDFNFHMGEMGINKENKTTTFRLFEYSLTFYNDRIQIKKIADECT